MQYYCEASIKCSTGVLLHSHTVTLCNVSIWAPPEGPHVGLCRTFSFLGNQLQRSERTRRLGIRRLQTRPTQGLNDGENEGGGPHLSAEARRRLLGASTITGAFRAEVGPNYHA